MQILDEALVPADAAARRLRERYIAARFLQFPQPAQALKNTANVMRWARQLMDDDQPRQASELLQLALEEDASQKPLWLFLIALAYLSSDPGLFIELSDRFRQRFPDFDGAGVMDAMARRLLPADPRFAHAADTFIMPDWSTPESELRDELRQQRLHASLAEAMTSLLAR